MEEDDQIEEIEHVEADDFEGPRKKWDRMREESKRAYQAFCLYRDSEKRQLIDVAARLIPPCSVQNVSRWCVRHMWHDRVWAYDAEQEEQERLQLARDRSAMRRRHLQLAMQMQSIAAHGLAELQEKIRM